MFGYQKNCKKSKKENWKRCENMFGYRETLRKLKENDKIGIYIYTIFKCWCGCFLPCKC